MPSAASNIDSADATANRRRRSTSRRKKEKPITRTGRATRPATHSRASLILILASFDRDRPPRRDDDIAEPLVETGQLASNADKRLDDETVEEAVEKAAFERDQEQAPFHPFRGHCLEIAAGWRRAVADGILH